MRNPIFSQALRSFPRVFAATIVFVGLLLAIGCGGGGGGSAPYTPSSAEREVVAERVRSILAALASGRGDALESFRRSTTGTSGTTTNRFHRIYVRDFGDNLDDPSDDVVNTFWFDANDIVFASEDMATLPIWTWLTSGAKLGLEMHLFRIGGRWYLDDLTLQALTPAQAANSGGPLPSTAVWPMARDDRWLLVELSASTTASLRTSRSPSQRGLALDPRNASFRTFMANTAPTTGVDGRQVFQLSMSAYTGDPASASLTPPFDAASLRFGLFENGLSAVDQGFFTTPTGAVIGATLWDTLDPARLGQLRVFEQSGVFLQGADSGFNGGQPWRLTDILVQDGAGATQSITLAAPGKPLQTGEARILVMDSVSINLPWLQGQARRFDISMTWQNSNEVTWTSLFFLPGLGIVGYADYDPATREPVRVGWLQAASVGGQQYLPAGETGTLAPFVTLAINPVPVLTWTAGIAASHTMVASGGSTPYTWSLTGAPTWLSIDGNLGILAGTPTTPGSYSFTVAVRDGGNRAAFAGLTAFVATGSGTSTGTGVATAPIAAPIVTGVTPAAGVVGAQALALQITGQNFFGTPQVRLATSTTAGPTRRASAVDTIRPARYDNQ